MLLFPELKLKIKLLIVNQKHNHIFLPISIATLPQLHFQYLLDNLPPGTPFSLFLQALYRVVLARTAIIEERGKEDKRALNRHISSAPGAHICDKKGEGVLVSYKIPTGTYISLDLKR